MSTIKEPSNTFIARVIDWSVSNRLLILVIMAAILVAGIYAIKSTPLDAIPDLTDTQVIIRTEFPGQSPQIVENLVTYPVSSIMLGLPETKDVRGFSMLGTSFVYIIFKDGVDQYWARSRVTEALSKIQEVLPTSAKTRIGPDATGVGWVYQYALVDKSGKHDLSELRSLQDWFLKYELSTVSGVSEVATVGGFVKEYQVLVSPDKLRFYNIPLSEIIEVVRSSSAEVGGRVLEKSETEFIISSRGYIEKLADIEKISIMSDRGTPVFLKDIARIVEGPALRRGVVELNGEGEVVGGIVIMRSGENALNVINNIKSKIASLKPSLPEGVEIVEVYDRAPLVEGSIKYLTHKLIEEAIVVSLVCLIFLLHARSAFVAIITLPLGILAAFIVMSAQGITANIMSLGGIAIAIGAMIDASIVMVENASRKLSESSADLTRSEKNRLIINAVKEVGPGLFFSLLIITVSFLPVFALTGQSYRLFSPLAFTKTYAMFFAAILSVTVVPVLMLWLIRGKIRKEEHNPVNRFFIALYRPILELALKRTILSLFIAVILLVSTIWPITKTGTEFMPALYEGELLYMPTTLPGISIGKAKEVLQQTNRLIKQTPEVELVFGKVGNSDSATDPAPITMIETWVKLKPKNEWREGFDIKKLITDLDNRVKLPGLVNSWGYPIKIRMDMVSTGIRTPVGIKISGDNLEEINKVAVEVENTVKTIPGTRSALAERVVGDKYIEIIPKREELARYNIRLDTFQDVIQTALGGMKLAEAIEGRKRYDIMVRYDAKFRETPEDIGNIYITSMEGAHIPLATLADIKIIEGPPMLRSENARLSGWVFVDIADRDMGGYVTAAQKIIAEKIKLPAGYSISWSGQFQQMIEARERLQIAIPVTIASIFVLLLIHFSRIDRTLMVMLSLPFGMIGGVWLLYLVNYNFSVAVAVGFIALAGIAAETAVIMLIYLDQQVRSHPPKTSAELLECIMHGAVLRIRPKLMTVSVIILGLLPIFLTEGPGADVTRRIALPMIGGMISTTILTLIIIPVIYYIWESRKLRNK